MRDNVLANRRIVGRAPGWRSAPRWALLLLVIASGGMYGCEIDSFLDPSVVGRWERTPVTLPILSRLDVIDEPPSTTMEVTSVRPADLKPDVQEYQIGPGDLLTISIFELIMPGQESRQTRRVDETGEVRLPVIGTVRAANRTPSELEQAIRDTLEQQGVLRDAMVSVILQEARQNTFSVIGEPSQGGTAVGTYAIPKPNFRLLDALAMARGVPGRTKKLLVYRQTELTEEVAGEVEQAQQEEAEAQTQPAPAEQPEELIDELMQEQQQNGAPGPAGPQQRGQREAPTGVAAGIEGGQGTQWVNVEGEWVRVERDDTSDGAAAAASANDLASETDATAGQPTAQEVRERELGELITQRIIEVPYDKLLAGDMRYNVVIRPGDVIRVPAPTAGFVYIMGQINRPGAYSIPGENDLTLKQLIASAGNLSQLAIPERVDLVRRVDDNMEATVRLNVRAIFEGTQPDIFLKPNDLINVGTSFPATPLAILRNGFRATYGFGFVLDRNFESDVFGDTN